MYWVLYKIGSPGMFSQVACCGSSYVPFPYKPKLSGPEVSVLPQHSLCLNVNMLTHHAATYSLATSHPAQQHAKQRAGSLLSACIVVHLDLQPLIGAPRNCHLIHPEIPQRSTLACGFKISKSSNPSCNTLTQTLARLCWSQLLFLNYTLWQYVMACISCLLTQACVHR